jgi:hypothetical protein
MDYSLSGSEECGEIGRNVSQPDRPIKRPLQGLLWGRFLLRYAVTLKSSTAPAKAIAK